jgi:hypothetical protein
MASRRLALVITIFMVGSHFTPGGILRPKAEGGLLRVKVPALYAPPLVPPVNSRGTPRQVTRETSVSEGRNWTRNGRPIWSATPTST